jgi:hypothetical protein
MSSNPHLRVVSQHTRWNADIPHHLFGLFSGLVPPVDSASLQPPPHLHLLVLALVCVDRALFPTYVARYLMTQSSPALLEKLEGAVQRELAHLRGNSDVEDKKLFVKVGQQCSKAKVMRAFRRRRERRE